MGACWAALLAPFPTATPAFLVCPTTHTFTGVVVRLPSTGLAFLARYACPTHTPTLYPPCPPHFPLAPHPTTSLCWVTVEGLQYAGGQACLHTRAHSTFYRLSAALALRDLVARAGRHHHGRARHLTPPPCLLLPWRQASVPGRAGQSLIHKIAFDMLQNTHHHTTFAHPRPTLHYQQPPLEGGNTPA